MWNSIRRSVGVTDEEVLDLLAFGPSGLHESLNVYTEKKQWGWTGQQLARYNQEFENEAPLVAEGMCAYDPIDLMDCFREHFAVNDMPSDKYSLAQVCCLFTTILAMRKADDVRRYVRAMSRAASGKLDAVLKEQKSPKGPKK